MVDRSRSGPARALSVAELCAADEIEKAVSLPQEHFVEMLLKLEARTKL
jgi:hypothetical protein